MVGRSAFQCEGKEIDRIAAHQVGHLDHVANRVAARVKIVRDFLRHVGLNDARSPHLTNLSAVPIRPRLDLDLRQSALSLANLTQLTTAFRRVGTSTENVAVDYSNHAGVALIEEPSFREPYPAINDLP